MKRTPSATHHRVARIRPNSTVPAASASPSSAAAFGHIAEQDPDRAHRLAVLLQRSGQQPLAEATWRQIALHAPLHAGAQSALAAIEWLRGDIHTAKARADLVEAISEYRQEWPSRRGAGVSGGGAFW